jgi:uncharacterized protein YggE
MINKLAEINGIEIGKIAYNTNEKSKLYDMAIAAAVEDAKNKA